MNTYQMLFELNASLGGGFNAAFSQGNKQVEAMRAQLEALNSTGSTSDLIGGISAALETVGVIKGLEAVYDTLSDCAEVAAQFETAMAGVKRTVGGDDSFINSLGESFKQLSTQIPITADELAGIATTAGQLGIAQQNVEQFTTVMAQLGTTTDLTADNAATMLAQFANITGTTEYDRLGSVVASLGDATATTASKVVDMAQGMAASAHQAGMNERDILAIAAAVGSLGIEAAAGSTAMSTLISTLYKSTETGDKLQQFASIAGMTSEQFKKSWGEDAVGTMNQFIQGLNDTERNGRSAVVILDELGIKNVRQTKAILGLASAGDLLTRTISQSNDAWNQNTALADKAGVMYDTTEAKMTMMQNAATNLQIAVGDALTPMIGSAADGLTDMIEPIAEFIEANPAIIQGLTAFTGVLGTATAAIGAFTAVSKIAAAASALFGAAIPGVGIIMGVAAAIGGLTLGVGLLADAYDAANPSFDTLDKQFDELNQKAKEQQEIIDLAEEYKALVADIESTEAAIKFKAELDIGDITDENLRKIDELKGKMEDKTAELKQTLELAGADDITDEDIQHLIDLASNVQTSDDTIRQNLELIGIENVTPEMINQVREFANTITSDSGLLEQQLRLIGFDDDTVTSMGYGSYKDFVDDVAAGNLVVNADGTVTQRLNLGEVSPTDMDLIREIAENNGYAVSAEGVVTQTLDIGQVKSSDIDTLERMKQNITNDTAKLSQTLELVGVDDITPEKLQRYLDLKVNTKDGDYNLKQQLYLDGVENIDRDKLNRLKEFIKAVQSKTGKAEQKLSAIIEDDQISKLGYSSLKEFTEAVMNGDVVINKNGTITQTINVAGDVEKLKEAHEQEKALAEAENASSAAADELAAKRERLKAITDELRSSSGGLITATDNETDAMLKQVEAYEAIAKARRASYTSQAQDVIKKQSQQYADSIRATEEAQVRIERATRQGEIAREFTTSGDAAEYLRNELDQLTTEVQGYTGFNWMSDTGDDAKELQERFYGLQETINAITGQNYDFSNNGLAGMDATLDEIEVGTLAAGNGWQVANDKAKEQGEIIENNARIQQEYIQNLVDGIVNGTLKEEELQALLEAQFEGYENGSKIVADTMNQVVQGVEAAKAAAEGAGDAAQTEADKAVAAVSNIISRMEELRQAYESAKESALKTLSGRFSLFGEVGEAAESISTDKMQSNMAAQQRYWEQYNQNLQSVLDKGLSKEIAQQLSDGSADSAAQLAMLANASETEIQKINESFQQVEASKELVASTIADMETNFTEGMEKLKEELNDTVEELNKDSEAAAAAKATMDAYVAELAANEGRAASQAQSIANAVNAALSSIMTNIDININAHYNGFDGGSSGSSSSSSSSNRAAVVRNRFASGTDYAPEGLAYVGENGPELMYLNGGEKILNANETANLVSRSASDGGNYVTVNFSPSYNIQGGDAANIRAVLQEHDQNMYDQVQLIMEEINTDRMRTSYT